MTTMTANGRHLRFRELAATALDFPLAPAEAAELDAHLATCPACARLAGSLRFDAVALRRPAELATSYRLDTAIGAAIAGRPARRSPQQTLLLVAATALLLVALLGAAAVGAFLWRTLQPPLVVVDPSPRPPAFVVDPSPVPSGEPGPGVPALAWELGSIPPMIEGGESIPVAVTGGDGGFVAVGGRVFVDNETPSGPTASAWRSDDGLAWTPAATDGLALGGPVPMDDEPAPGIADVAWGPAGWVAVGIDIDGSGSRVGAIWRSDDGVTWERMRPIGRDVLDALPLVRPAAVTWHGSAYVMVGVLREEAAPRAAAWRSTNGRAFFQGDDSDAFDIGGYVTLPSAMGSGGLADVTAAPDGSLVAVGISCTATASMDTQSACRPIVLRSDGAVALTLTGDDGVSWVVVPGPSVTGIGLPSVAVQGDRFVAVAGGTGGLRNVQATGPVGGDAATARVAVGDADGWRIVEPAGVPPFERVAAYGDWFLAVSSAGNRITLWSSTDGEAWTEVPGVPQPPTAPDQDPEMQAFSDVDLAVAGGRVVITGRNQADPVGSTAFSIVGRSATPVAQVTPAPTTTPTPLPDALIAYVAQVEGRPWVHVVRPDGSGDRALAEGDAPAWSPDGGSIAFECPTAAPDVGLPDICVIDTDGAGQRRIVVGGLHPAWSPDGTRILFGRSMVDAGDAWIANADGSDARSVGAGTGSWSPDGSWVALIGASGAEPDVTVVRTDGTEAHQLGSCWGAAWSPDSSRLACAWWDESRGRLIALDVVSGATTTLLDADVAISDPTWISNDRLAFTIVRDGISPRAESPENDLHLLDVDTGDSGRLTAGLGLSIAAPIDVSADGGWLTFTVDNGEDRDVHVVSLAGEVRRVTAGGANGKPAWQPRPDAGSSSGSPWPQPLVGFPACRDAAAPADQAFASGVVHTDYRWTPHAFRRSDAVGGVALAQTVTAGRAGLLAGLELRLTGRALAGDLPVEVRDGTPDGAMLGRGTLGQADLEAGGWIRVALDPAPVVSEGQVIAIVLPALAPTHSADSVTAQPAVTWVSSLEAKGDYAGGTGFAGTRDGQSADAGSWDSFAHDRHVRTYVCTQATES